jgi:hypothetical protein
MISGGMDLEFDEIILFNSILTIILPFLVTFFTETDKSSEENRSDNIYIMLEINTMSRAKL